MPDLALIAQAVDFVEDCLCEPIGVADMADAVGYSLYHFCRTFNQATHHTPYDYLMRRRLSEAAQVLLKTDDKIIDIGLDFQFNNPETFSRAFKRIFGTQPSQLRIQGRIDPWRLVPRLTLAHLEHIHRGDYLRPTVLDWGGFEVIGIMALVKDSQALVSDLWDLLLRELAPDPESTTLDEYYGIAHYPEGWETRGFFYMAAVEGQGVSTANTCLVARTIPPLEWAKFIHSGPRRTLFLTLDYIFHTWLPKSDRRLSRPWIVEHYRMGLADDDAAEIDILIPLEKPPR